MELRRDAAASPLDHARRALDGAARAVAGGSRRLRAHLEARAGAPPFARAAGAGAGDPLRALGAGLRHLQRRLPGGAPTPPADDDALDLTGDGVLAVEFLRNGRRRVYRAPRGAGAPRRAPRRGAPPPASRGRGAAPAGAGFDVGEDAVSRRHALRHALGDYLLPQGFPASVAPQYATYMNWRGVQYFFGGAMSVFTTRSLLGALGVANAARGGGAAAAAAADGGAAAINWVLKDGAGRLGRFLFARWGRSLDCELKQFRLAGDALMEAGALLELATAAAPAAFLPLACTANLAKNLAAVAASSTRAPIYRTFARANNLADVTAKAESVANLADVVGTAFGIALARAAAPAGPAFAALSAGYLLASRREVDSVVLPYLNRGRLSYAARAFFARGGVPGLAEANAREPLLPWADPVGGRVALGAAVGDACGSPAQLAAAAAAFAGRPYALTWRADTRRVYCLLREGAGADAVLQAALAAHAVVWLLDHGAERGGGGLGLLGGHVPGGGYRRKGAAAAAGPDGGAAARGGGGAPPREVARLHRAAAAIRAGAGGEAPADAALRFAASADGAALVRAFERAARARGWQLSLSMLNPAETRVRLAD